jgi:hypothetical protein
MKAGLRGGYLSTLGAKQPPARRNSTDDNPSPQESADMAHCNANSLDHSLPTGQTERRKIETPEELSAVLKENFLIRLPDGCGPTLERLIQSN